MTHLWKCAAVIALAAGLAFAQQPAPSPSESSAASTPLPDSKSLEFVHAEKAQYPIIAQRDRIQGQVVVRVHISETGDVDSAEVVSGNPVLAEAALNAARKCKFKPFIRNGKPVKAATTLPFDFHFEGNVFRAPQTTSELASASTPTRVKVSSGVMDGLVIRKVNPEYPREAKLNRIQGSVILHAIIGRDGRLKELTAISGPQELIPATIGAVQQWLYKPYYLNGQPVEIDTQITVNFKLSGSPF